MCVKAFRTYSRISDSRWQGRFRPNKAFFVVLTTVAAGIFCSFSWPVVPNQNSFTHNQWFCSVLPNAHARMAKKKNACSILFKIVRTFRSFSTKVPGWFKYMQPGKAAMINVAKIVSPSATAAVPPLVFKCVYVCPCASVHLECVWYAVVPRWRQI